MVVFQGRQFACDFGLQSMIVESDSKPVISILLSNEFDLSEIGALTRDIKVLATYFVGCRFCFSRRSCNALAHALASKGLQLDSDHFWVEEAPSFVDRHVARDRSFQEPP
ncbi:hypothetical protein GQ457_10G007970 [Hibiscus cannabinus]